MKKIMSLMLGLSLVLGSVAFAEDKKADTSTAPKKEKKAKKEKKTKGKGYRERKRERMQQAGERGRV